MDFVLRPASLADLDPIMAIETSTFGNDAWSTHLMRGELVSKHTTYLAATASDHPDELAGYAGMLAPAGSGNTDIQTIAVAPFARRYGLGRMLMLALVAEARMRGAAFVFLEVRADNPNARALYDELGFDQIAVRSQYYQPDGVDAHVMRLAL